MFAFSRLKSFKISAKLSAVVGSALLALCVMGAIAVFAARETQRLGYELYTQNNQLLTLEAHVAIDIERAIAAVHAAPSEVDLQKLKVTEKQFRSILDDALKTLEQELAADAASEVKAGSAQIASTIDTFGKASKKVFDFCASFAQPDAIAALSSAVAPAEAAMQDALKQFQGAVAKTNADQNAVIQQTTKTITWTVLGLAAFLVVLIGVLSYAIVSRITGPLTKLAAGLLQIADGNLDVEVAGLGRKDEIGQIADAVDTMVERVGSIVRNIKVAANEVTGSSSEISTSTTDLSQRTEEQAASLEQTTASMEQISVTVRKSADNARQANKFAGETTAVAERGGAVVEEAVSAMARIEESSRKISDIIGVIDEIARQTNLLALNAAVEAARAGEAGRGFAVVASEVRSLAQRSSQAAKDIKDLITNSNGLVKDGVSLVNKAGQSLSEIVASIKKVADIVADIANAATEQSSGLEHINKALTQMDEVTQQNSALVEENAATAKTLEHQARAMDEQVAYFKVGGGADAVSAAKEPAEKMAVVAQAPAAKEQPKPKPVVQLKQVAAGGGGAVRKIQRTAAVNADADWREF